MRFLGFDHCSYCLSTCLPVVGIIFYIFIKMFTVLAETLYSRSVMAEEFSAKYEYEFPVGREGVNVLHFE